MKKIVIIASSVVLLLLFGVFLFLKAHPPLTVDGLSINKDKNPFTVVVSIENKGFADIKLQQVLVNTNHKPPKIELGISRSNLMLSIAEVYSPGKGISFHHLGDYPIKTPPKSKYESMNFDTIRHYGIAIFNHDEIKNITIKYSYLGVSFEKKIEVTFD